LSVAVPVSVTTRPDVDAPATFKDVVRRYADENLPGWACVGVSFRLGEVGAHVAETLLVLPGRDGGVMDHSFSMS